ncbi:MAG: nucleotidyltransferase family protein [Anaerolineales bacterium]|jgi:molybdenum cofactor cytidylyltransferase|nr:nucleotidyltransferase family protein [Anaerolineales bacterium]MCC6986272.1 nucleotidyltransferase family protein [Anaerolineales bacterium]
MMISAIVLAAGRSTRMGMQKMLMPWGNTTVLESVVQTLQNSGIEDIIIVTNLEISKSIFNYQSFNSAQDKLPITINNNGEMLASIQAGLRAQNPSAEAALICLGDQPQMEEGSVRSVCEAYSKGKSNLIAPSYQMRRGHPWLAAKPLWDEILAMTEGQTMRGFLNRHADEIEYVPLDTPTILQDLDTPDDYLKYKPPL